MKDKKQYTMSDKRILEDLKKSSLKFGVKLELARKRNQGISFGKLSSWLEKEHNIKLSRQRICDLLNTDIKLIERKTKIAQENDLF